MNAPRTSLATGAFVSRSDNRLSGPLSGNDWRVCFDESEPYPLYSRRRGAGAATAPLPPSDDCAPTPPSSGRGHMSPFARGRDDVTGVAQHDVFPAKMQALSSGHCRQTDGANSHNFEDEVAPSATHSRRNRKRTLLSKEVPKHGKRSVLEQDAHTAVESLGDRVKIASQRVARTYESINRLSSALDISKAKDKRAMAQAVPLEQATHAASTNLARARAEASAARTRFESCSRPRRVFNYLKAKWEAGAQPLGLDEAEQRVGEALKVLSAATAESDRAWKLVHESFHEAEAASRKLRNEQDAHASAKKVLVGLEAALVRAKKCAVRTANDIEIARYWAGECYVRGGDGGLGRLFFAARVAARAGACSSGDQIEPEKAKRARH